MLHRVVWDEVVRGRGGLHLRSAKLDGTDKRKVYDTRRGWTLDLTLDRAGKWVAFSPCCRASLPTMVVARVRGGKVLEPLARHPKIDFVGGIGWSPDGRRIAFEGTTGRYPNRITYLWTIRPDGTGLRRLMKLWSANRTIINDALAWTPDGILYTDYRRLWLAKAGESRLILRRVSAVRISGDGQHIVTRRTHRDGRQSVWIGDPDGTGQRMIAGPFDFGEDPWYGEVTPNFDATALLAWRDLPSKNGVADTSALVTWNTDADPATAAIPAMLDANDDIATWN